MMCVKSKQVLNKKSGEIPLAFCCFKSKCFKQFIDSDK